MENKNKNMQSILFNYLHNLSKDHTVDYTRRFAVQCPLTISQVAFLISQCYFSPAYYKKFNYKNYVSDYATGLQYFSIIEKQDKWFYVTIYGFFLEKKNFHEHSSLLYHDRLFSLYCFFENQGWPSILNFFCEFTKTAYDPCCDVSNFGRFQEAENACEYSQFYSKSFFWGVWLQQITSGEISNLLIYLSDRTTIDLQLIFCDPDLKLLISSFDKFYRGCKFTFLFNEVYDYGFYNFYTLYKSITPLNFIVKNKELFQRFCQLNLSDSAFFCHGFVVEPLCDLILQQNLFSICGTIKLSKKNVDLFIYNLMQFIFPTLNISCVLLHRTTNCLYFWLVTDSLILKKKNMKIDFVEKNVNILTRTFLKQNMFSDTKNKPINSFFFGVYKSSSYLALYLQTVLHDGTFIEDCGDDMTPFTYALNLENDKEIFNSVLEKNNLCGNEWLFFGPTFALKEYSHCESISELKFIE